MKGAKSYTQHPIFIFISYSTLSPSYRAFALSSSFLSIRQDWREAISNPRLKEAMIGKMKTPAKNETGELIFPLQGQKLVSCKWVLTMKHRVDGSKLDWYLRDSLEPMERIIRRHLP